MDKITKYYEVGLSGGKSIFIDDSELPLLLSAIEKTDPTIICKKGIINNPETSVISIEQVAFSKLELALSPKTPFDSTIINTLQSHRVRLMRNGILNDDQKNTLAEIDSKIKEKTDALTKGFEFTDNFADMRAS